MEIEGKKINNKRYKEMTGGTDESRESKNKTLDRLTVMISTTVFLDIIFP